jgi:hypothetical protein
MSKTIQKRLISVKKYVGSTFSTTDSVTYLLGAVADGSSLPVIITNVRVGGTVIKEHDAYHTTVVWAIMTKQAGIDVLSPDITSGNTALKPEKNVMLWACAQIYRRATFNCWIKHFDDVSLGERKLGIKDNLVFVCKSDISTVSWYFVVQFFQCF